MGATSAAAYRDNGGVEPVIISVVVTTHNRAGLLRQALESIMAQVSCGAEIEVIVVDDASTDDTPAVVASYPDIRYLCTAQGTAAGSRNVGIQHARGEWIAFLDDDDAWLPHKLRRCFSLLIVSPQASLIYSAAFICDSSLQPSGGIWAGPLVVKGKVSADAFLDRVVSPSGVLIRREVFDRVGYFDPAMLRAEDRDMWLRAIYGGVICIGTEEPLFLYRTRDAVDGEMDYIGYTTTLTVLRHYLGKHNVQRPSWRRRKQVLWRTRGWYAHRMLEAARQAKGEGRPDLAARFRRAAFRISPVHAVKGQFISGK